MSLSKHDKTRVRNWMLRFAEHYANETLLAEGCGDDLGLYVDTSGRVGGDPFEIDEDVYDIAMEFFDDNDNHVIPPRRRA